jgi:ABC-type hemin transport system ATPase subunit
MLCVVHDLDLVPTLAHRALVLRQGRLVADVRVTSSTPGELRPLLQ